MSEVEEHPLLIIEGDAARLEGDGLSCAQRISDAARLLGVEPVVVRATTRTQLLNGLAEAAAAGVFDAVVIIAHGNSEGVVLASDMDLVSWEDLADWVGPLEPERVAFIACQAARTIAASSLFEAIESLDEVYASPLNMNLTQSRAIDFLMPCLIDGEFDEDWIRLVQAGQILVGKGLLFRYTRDAYEEGDEASDLARTLFEEHLLPDLARAGFTALRDLLGMRS